MNYFLVGLILTMLIVLLYLELFGKMEDPFEPEIDFTEDWPVDEHANTDYCNMLQQTRPNPISSDEFLHENASASEVSSKDGWTPS